MGNSWLIPLAAVLVGSGGIGTILGVLVQRRQTTMVNNAAIVGIAMDGLTKLTQEQRADLDEARAEIDRLKKQLNARTSRRPT